MTASDMKWVWAAYRAESFPWMPQEMDQKGLEKFIVELSTKYQSLEIVEDENTGFSSGFGPIAIVGAFFDGWRFQPHVEFFKWVTDKSILKCTVAYIQKVRYRKGVGVVTIHSLPESKNLFDHVTKYGVLHYRGKIPNGSPRGDEYVYSTRGTQKTEEEEKINARA